MATVTVVQGGKTRVFSALPATALSDLLAENGYAVSRPCGGRGTCGKCSAKIVYDEKSSRRTGTYLICQTLVTEDMTVYLQENQSMQIESHVKTGTSALPLEQTGLGVAVDIGTTTVVMQLYDRATGALLAENAVLNPQTSVAADVVGRIEASLNGKHKELTRLITDALEDSLEKVAKKANTREKIQAMVITGNTTMLYLLTGHPVDNLARAPFHADELFHRTAELLGQQVYLPPCISAFVGADISCAVMASRMCEKDETALLCDIGTNGELALWHKGRLYVTSTAAGPAFEGVGISCGCASITGAIDRVWEQEGRVAVHTIGEAEPAGLCGSGLIDAVATLLRMEYLDETGAMDEPFHLSEKVSLQPKDIRQVQLAKAAICGGIETLLAVAEISAADIEKIYLAGGFGSRLREESAISIGLIPAAFAGKTVALGNAALAGAVELLLYPEKQAQICSIAENAQLVNLGGNPLFNERYIENIMFPFEETL